MEIYQKLCPLLLSDEKHFFPVAHALSSKLNFIVVFNEVEMNDKRTRLSLTGLL